MRNLSCSVIALALALAAVACGPSGKQVATAKQARYQGDRSQIFAVMQKTVAAKYKIQKADEAAFGLQTDNRWYSQDGQPVSGTLDDVANVPDRGLNISLVVELLPDGERHMISVKPVIVRYVKGHAQPEEVRDTDPTLPEWIHDRITELQLDLYKALQQYEAKGAAGSAAPAAPAGGTMPAGGSGAPDPAGTMPAGTGAVPGPAQ
jgi:hypothetical protein